MRTQTPKIHSAISHISHCTYTANLDPLHVSQSCAPTAGGQPDSNTERLFGARKPTVPQDHHIHSARSRHLSAQAASILAVDQAHFSLGSNQLHRAFCGCGRAFVRREMPVWREVGVAITSCGSGRCRRLGGLIVRLRLVSITRICIHMCLCILSYARL